MLHVLVFVFIVIGGHTVVVDRDVVIDEGFALIKPEEKVTKKENEVVIAIPCVNDLKVNVKVIDERLIKLVVRKIEQLTVNQTEVVVRVTIYYGVVQIGLGTPRVGLLRNGVVAIPVFQEG